MGSVREAQFLEKGFSVRQAAFSGRGYSFRTLCDKYRDGSTMTASLSIKVAESGKK